MIYQVNWQVDPVMQICDVCVPFSFCIEGVQLCARGHIFLLANETSGVTLHYINTHLSHPENVTIDDHHLPPPSICGNRSGRCGMSLVNSSDGNILVIVFPLNGGLGLISFQSDNGSFCFREKRFLAQNLVDGCTFVFFAPFSSQTHLIGYCLDVTNQMLHSIFVQIHSFESLGNSRISQNDAYGAFDIQNNLYLSNFLFFPNTDFCFSNENGHTIFIRSSDVIDHSFDDIEYYVHGSIDVPSCSTSEPRLQQLKSECKVGVYCDSTTTLLDSPEQFSGSGGIVARLATGTDEQAFLCSSEYFVHFRNKTLSIRDVTNQNQVGRSLPFNAEVRIIFGDCLISESNFYFVSTFSNSKTVFFDFNNLSSLSLGEHEENTTSIPYIVQNQLLFINNRTTTLIYNWTRMCEDVLTLPVTFDLALSFVDERTTERCGCVPELTTTETSSDLSSTTDRNVVRPTTSDSSNSGLTTNTMDSSQDINELRFFGIAVGAAALVMVIPLLLIIILTVVIIIACG